MGALTRIFREDSKKNFGLATNILSIFFRLSQFSEYHPFFSNWKIGTLSMQLIEYELSRSELWNERSLKATNGEERRKWTFTLSKQNQLISFAINMLKNLAQDIEIENKMLKRNLIDILAKCTKHFDSPGLLTASVKFLWKLSVFVENLKQISDMENLIEGLVGLIPNASRDLVNSLFPLLFNLSFINKNRKRMVAAGLVNFSAPHIEENKMALALLYQLSIVNDAKPMFAFTDLIQTLLKMLFQSPNSDLIKALLVNICLEKRNAQLLCGSDSQGLNSLMSFALENECILSMKIARNIAVHSGSTQKMFSKWIPQLVENVLSKTMQKQENNKQKFSSSYYFALVCMEICANLAQINWSTLDDCYKIVDFIRSVLEGRSGKQADRSGVRVDTSICLPNDNVVLLAVLWCGAMAADGLEMAKRISTLVPLLISTLNKKHEDDEIVLQIVVVFYCLLSHSELAKEFSGEDSKIAEHLLKLMHDKNTRLREFCDQTLQIIANINKFWRERLNEDRFIWHNSQWLEMVVANSEDSLNTAENEADEILGNSLFSELLFFEDAEKFLFENQVDDNM